MYSKDYLFFGETVSKVITYFSLSIALILLLFQDYLTWTNTSESFT